MTASLCTTSELAEELECGIAAALSASVERNGGSSRLAEDAGEGTSSHFDLPPGWVTLSW